MQVQRRRHQGVTVALPDNEAHLWWIRPSAVPEHVRVRAWAWLTPEEQARQQRYMFERDRLIHLVTRGLVRSVLSMYTAISPEALAFGLNPWGRPELLTPSGVLPPRFNLSNTDGMVVMLVAARREVGADVERMDRRATVEVADRFFASAEVTSLRALPDAAQSRRFFEYWTLKESYIKARGMGLAIPLHHFGFRLQAGQPVTVDIDPSLHDDPARWQFEQRVLDETFLVAAAIQRTDGRDATLAIRHADHLVSTDS